MAAELEQFLEGLRSALSSTKGDYFNLDRIEEHVTLAALRNLGSRRAAAKALGIARSTLKERLRRYELR